MVTRFANTVYAPTDAGYTPADRPRLDNARIRSLLVGAGFERGPAVTAESDSESGEEPAPESSGASWGLPRAGLPRLVSPFRTGAADPDHGQSPRTPAARRRGPGASSAGAPSSGISEPSSGYRGCPESAGAERTTLEMASVPVRWAPFQRRPRSHHSRRRGIRGSALWRRWPDHRRPVTRHRYPGRYPAAGR